MKVLFLLGLMMFCFFSLLVLYCCLVVASKSDESYRDYQDEECMQQMKKYVR